jgi:hypothetical protein
MPIDIGYLNEEMEVKHLAAKLPRGSGQECPLYTSLSTNGIK